VTQILPVAAQNDPVEGQTANVVYILYLVSLIAGVTSIIGVIMAYVYRADAPEWVKTHYRFQIRTFWIALLYAFLSLLTAILIVGLFFAVFTFIWWIVRSVKGLKLLSQGAAHENPATWLW
jgi:uncharacterized membrane protein